MKENHVPLSPTAVKAGWVWMAVQFALLPQLVGLLGVDAARSNFLLHAVSALAAGVIFREALIDGLRRGIGHWKRFLGVCALALAGYYAAGGAVSWLIEGLDPTFLNRNDQVFFDMKEQWILLLLTTVVLAPVSEECLFRGLLFSRLAERNRVFAYLLSCLCFALIHVLGFLGKYTPLQFALAMLQYIPAGLMLAWAQERSGLIAPIFIHAAINAVSVAQVLFL